MSVTIERGYEEGWIVEWSNDMDCAPGFDSPSCATGFNSEFIASGV